MVLKMCKIGKSIIKHIEELACEGKIASYDITDESVAENGYNSITIDIEVNELYKISIYNEIGLSNTTTGWVAQTCARNGLMMYYCMDRTQKELCKTLDDRVKYGNAVLLNESKSVYEGLSLNELIEALVNRDAEIDKLKKELGL